MARAKGEVPTGAKFIREYILNHPLYKNDSKISQCLQCCLINQITNLNKDTDSVCQCAMTESESHNSDCCDKTLNFLKGKGGNNNKSNSLFEASSNNSDLSDTPKLDLET